MIGNDIIDLRLAKTQSNWQRKGFLEKQFTHKEQAIIKRSKNPFEMVWRMWSMKEAAYKIVVQQENRRFFAPQKFECEILSTRKGLVIYQNQIFETKTNQDSGYIYTYIDQKGLRKGIVGEFSKEELKEKIAFEIEKRSIQIRKNAFGVPTIYNNARPISQSCSITHHGNYSAIEFIPF